MNGWFYEYQSCRSLKMDEVSNAFRSSKIRIFANFILIKTSLSENIDISSIMLYWYRNYTCDPIYFNNIILYYKYNIISIKYRYNFIKIRLWTTSERKCQMPLNYPKYGIFAWILRNKNKLNISLALAQLFLY